MDFIIYTLFAIHDKAILLECYTFVSTMPYFGVQLSIYQLARDTNWLGSSSSDDYAPKSMMACKLIERLYIVVDSINEKIKPLK